MIPAKIIRFLEERASIAFAGTRDGNLVPCGHRVSGWQIDAPGRTVTAFVPSSSADRLFQALKDNGRIAITFADVSTHETYQIKGRYVSHRPVRLTEMDVTGRVRERFGKGLSPYPDEGLATLAKASIPVPSLAVEVEVQEVFLQTPGPGAGARIAPPPDAERSAT